MFLWHQIHEKLPGSLVKKNWVRERAWSVTSAYFEEPWFAMSASSVGGHHIMADGFIFISTVRARKKFNPDQTDGYQIPDSFRWLVSQE